MGKIVSPICSFCKMGTKTMEHLFWDCYVTSSFLLNTEQFFFGRQFILTRKDFFFGYNLVIEHPMNFFILHCKYYVYNLKINETLPKSNEFFYKMKFILKVETYINSKPGTSRNASRKFNILKDCFAHLPSFFE